MKHPLSIALPEAVGRQSYRDWDLNFKHSKQTLWLTFRLHCAMAYTVASPEATFLVEAA
ncbi:hypothetical protein HanPSC8_Chr14g0618551 [Helianthus annuus]|nr:hypothetical protein HanPSC8_Chr14g0618551 [Helianthus annuus]